MAYIKLMQRCTVRVKSRKGETVVACIIASCSCVQIHNEPSLNQYCYDAGPALNQTQGIVFAGIVASSLGVHFTAEILPRVGGRSDFLWIRMREREVDRILQQCACRNLANARRSPSVGSMLGQRHRRWTNIEPTMGRLPRVCKQFGTFHPI